MKKFLGPLLAVSCFIFVFSSAKTYALPTDCLGPTTNQLDPSCYLCGNCGCPITKSCQSDWSTCAGFGGCQWGCLDDAACSSNVCNAANTGLHGKCGTAGGCVGCQKCKHIGSGHFNCEPADLATCPSEPACQTGSLCVSYTTANPPPLGCFHTCAACDCPVGSWCENVGSGYGCRTEGTCSTIPNGSSPEDFSYSGLIFTNLEAVLTPAAKILFYASLVVGVLLIIYSGYVLMTSEGNPQRVQQGQEQLTASILGILFILLSAAILRVIISSILGA